MQVLSVRVGLTKNLGNYESAKVEVEAAPENGQNIDEFLSSVNTFLNEQVESAVNAAGGVKEKAPKKEKAATTPPLKAEKSGESSDSDHTNGVKDAEAAKPAAKAKASTKSTKAETQAKAANVNKPDAAKELKYTLESETLDELLDRFNTLRKLADDFGDKWEGAVTKIADLYRKLNSLDANPETLNQIVLAFKAERTAIEKMKSQSQATAA